MTGGVRTSTLLEPSRSLPFFGIVPASPFDELLSGRRYDAGGSRPEFEVAKLAWSHVIDPEPVDPEALADGRP